MICRARCEQLQEGLCARLLPEIQCVAVCGHRAGCVLFARVPRGSARRRTCTLSSGVLALGPEGRGALDLQLMAFEPVAQPCELGRRCGRHGSLSRTHPR
eukprot:scaffold3542_cov113-Isochrysis_galbana.AAC.6